MHKNSFHITCVEGGCGSVHSLRRPGSVSIKHWSRGRDAGKETRSLRKQPDGDFPDEGGG